MLHDASALGIRRVIEVHAERRARERGGGIDHALGDCAGVEIGGEARARTIEDFERAGLLTQFLLGRPLGIDELLWTNQFAAPTEAGPMRMASNTAVALALLGCWLLLRATGRRDHWLPPVLGGAVVAVSVLPLLGFVSLLPVFGAAPSLYSGMAVPTAAISAAKESAP